MPGCLRGWVRAETTHQVILKIDFKVNDHHGHFDSRQEFIDPFLWFLFMTALASFIDQNILKYMLTHPSIYLPIHLSTYLSIYQLIIQSINLATYESIISIYLIFICYMSQNYCTCHELRTATSWRASCEAAVGILSWPTGGRYVCWCGAWCPSCSLHVSYVLGMNFIWTHVNTFSAVVTFCILQSAKMRRWQTFLKKTCPWKSCTKSIWVPWTLSTVSVITCLSIVLLGWWVRMIPIH